MVRSILPPLVFFFGFVAPPESKNAMADRSPVAGADLLREYCFKCHGAAKRYPALDVTDEIGMRFPVEGEKPFLVAGDATESRIWRAIEHRTMPPEDQPQPTLEERERIRQWIDSGARFAPQPSVQRRFIDEQILLDVVASDLESLSEDDRRYARYFSLLSLHNQVTGKRPVSKSELRLARAAVSKLINSLSGRSRIVRPRIVADIDEVVLAIDLRNYGWTDRSWDQLLKAYPYGLKSAARVARKSESLLPIVRVDWFVATASRPPLYHELMSSPRNARALEERLGVNVQSNFQSGKLHRAAFQESGVSLQNRMVERHGAGSGYYWRSYDSGPNANLLGDFHRRPLGPVFEDTGDGRQVAAFQHDGGEIIYSLANGLQGYLLVDKHDVRIDTGPVDIVFDPVRGSGTVEIVNGISCMGCHKHGLVRLPADEVRPLFEGATGFVADKVMEVFPVKSKMNRLVSDDIKQFLRSLQAAIGPFVQAEEDFAKPLDEFDEPITHVARRYHRNVTIQEAAVELNIPNSKKILALSDLRTFRKLGVGNWANDGATIDRRTFESAYGRLARELGRGVPISFE